MRSFDLRDAEKMEYVFTEQVKLDVIKFATRYDIDGRTIADNTHLTVLPRAFGDMAFEVVHYTYGQSAEETVTHPATWWDAFKLRFFPAWALKRWPAQWTRVVVKAQALFPNLRVDRRRHDMHIIYRVDRL